MIDEEFARHEAAHEEMILVQLCGFPRQTWHDYLFEVPGTMKRQIDAASNSHNVDLCYERELMIESIHADYDVEVDINTCIDKSLLRLTCTIGGEASRL